MRSLYGVLNNLGALLLWFALVFLLPMAVALAYGEMGALRGFIAGGAIALFVGNLLRATTARYRYDLKPRDAFLLICTSMIVLAAVACTPLLLAVPRLGFTRAYFEAMSGLSTTGATVFGNLDDLPHSLNFWRHLLSWCGGMGVIVLAVAVLPLLGIGGMQLFRSGSTGSVKDSKLAPRILATARTLWGVYAGLTLLCALALWSAGMPRFDALCQALSTLSLGGFSTHNANIGYYNSPGIELVMMAFMLIAAMNFTTHFVALRKGDFSVYQRDHEARRMLLVVLTSCIVVAAFLDYSGVYASFFMALRHASFNVISVATGGGFFSTPYGNWPAFAPMWMLFLSCLCASSGSTGGGIKMFRSVILAKQSLREMFSLVHPQAVRPLKLAGQVVPNDVAYSVLAFIFLYFVTIMALTFLLLLSGLDVISAFSAVIACINNVGPGLNIVAPGANYGVLNDFQSWVCVAAMLLGRVEIITFAVLCTPTFWRK